MTIFVFAFKRSFRNLTSMMLLLAIPFLVIFLSNESWYALPIGYQLYGCLLFFTASRLVAVMLEDRLSGTLKRVAAAPISHFQYLLQNLLAHSLLLVVQCVIVVVGGILYGHELVQPLLLFIVYVLFAFMTIGFSLAWYSLFRSKDNAFSVQVGLIMILCMAGGMFWPVEVFPAFMQRLAMFLPTYWMAEAVRVISSGAGVAQLGIPSLILLLFTLAFLIVGSKRQFV